MNIFEGTPRDWVDLQNKVAHILSACGYRVETPKRIKTVRGEVEVDVYAINEGTKVICECKLWECRIPQNVIFAFRTVVADLGMNKGLIIAKKGFQSGAYDNIKNTNVELYTWQEFLDRYTEKYLKETIKKYMIVSY